MNTGIQADSARPPDYPLDAMAPYLPEDRSGRLRDLAAAIARESAALGAQVPAPCAQAIAGLVRFANCYYSNLIEGHQTHPRDIAAAMRRVYAADEQKRDLQIEARCHIEAQRRMRMRLRSGAQALDDLSAFVCQLHRDLCEHLPERMLLLTRRDGSIVRVVPGTLRVDDVTVGAHEPPRHERVPQFLQHFAEQYRPSGLRGVEQPLIAIAASHHRLVWLHPFLDGNGRVARLLIEAQLTAARCDAQGLWSPSRGLARHNVRYKELLADADAVRQGDLDGRGPRSLAALETFCAFFLEQAIDQIRFMGGLLDLRTLRDRIRDDISRRIAQGELPEGALTLVLALLIDGSVERGTALRMLGGAERTARARLSALIDEGLVAAADLSNRSEIRFAVPLHATEAWFPKLLPPPDAEEASAHGTRSLDTIESLRFMSDEQLLRTIDRLTSDHALDIIEHPSLGPLLHGVGSPPAPELERRIAIDDIDLFDDDTAIVVTRFAIRDTSVVAASASASAPLATGTAEFGIARDGAVSLRDVTLDTQPRTA